MLGDHLVFPIVLSTDLAASRAFYHDTLGLDPAIGLARMSCSGTAAGRS